MVVLSAAVMSKTGKILLARQFVDISRMRIEGLLVAFPKLIGTGGKQHTFVETDNVRYVYQPMEQLLLVLITNKTSNIIEDLETLRLLSRVIPEYCQTSDEQSISDAAFELLFAFDEVLSLGHRENVSLQQIRLYTDMESHEERLASMIRQSKINEAQDTMKQKAKALDKAKSEAAKSGHSFTAAGGIRSNDMSVPSIISNQFGSGNMGMGGGGGLQSTPGTMDSRSSPNPAYASGGGQYGSTPSAASTVKAPKKGMSLGGKPQKNDLLQSLRAEGDYNPEVAAAPLSTTAAPAAAAAASDNQVREKIHVSLDEKVTVDLSAEGDLISMEIKGDLTLKVTDSAVAACRIHLAPTSGAPPGFQFKSHPKVDKEMFSGSNILGLSRPDMPFPVDIDVGLLKWRMVTDNEELVPIHFECWFSNMGSSIEYELRGEELRNLVVTVPLRSPPKITKHVGDYQYANGYLTWRILAVDQTNRTGVLEWEADETECFPINVTFTSPRMYAGVKVANITLGASADPARFSSFSEMRADHFVIGPTAQ